MVGRIFTKLTGMKPHPWQQYVWDVQHEVLEDGSGWAYDETLESVPRQVGKTTKVPAVVAHRCGRAPGRYVWATAQNGDKAVARWDAASKVITAKLPDVKQLVSISHERTLWTNGSVFRPFVPKEGALDGETPDWVPIDELWAFDAADQEALENSFAPTVFMNPWGQVSKMSTAGTERSAWLNSDRARGRAAVESGAPGRFAYFEWGIPEQGLDDLTDVELVRLVLAHHPLTGRHPKITEAALLGELSKGTGKRSVFIRGMGNVTQETRLDGAVPADIWKDATAKALIPDGVRVGLGVSVDELGRESTIYAGWRDPDTGVGVVELVAQAAGSGWVAPRLQSVTDRWDVGSVAFHYSGPARAAADAAITRGVEVLKVYTPDMGAAATRFLEDLEAGRQMHDGARGTEITEAMQGAVLRYLQAGPVIEPSGTTPVTAMNAAVLAMWATDHLPEIEARIPFMIS